MLVISFCSPQNPACYSGAERVLVEELASLRASARDDSLSSNDVGNGSFFLNTFGLNIIGERFAGRA